ncbi:MAG: stage II sporulation protein M [Nocardioides sp.]
MDLDAYVLTHQPVWRRLEQLTNQSGLTGAESDELVELYQRAATHLSVVRTSAPDADIVAYLSSLLSRARNRTSGTRIIAWRGLQTFLFRRFPAALYRLRWWWLGCMAVNVVVTAVMMWWLLEHPNVEQSLLTPQQIEDLVTEDFENYYSESASSAFAAQVWINNAWVSALCIAFGVLGFPVVTLLFENMANLAVIGSIMTRNDHAGHFWGLLLPHGLLELTAVFVAGGVGAKLFWSWIEPGDLSRTKSLAREGRTAGTVALGLVLVLFVTGLIEGFVTPSGLPTWARVGIGILAELAFFAYVFGWGRQAHLDGEAGDIDARLLEDQVASVA